jgi:hypothetical protein
MLLPGTADDVEFQVWIGAFHQGLAQSGWIIGRNVRINARWAGVKAEEIRKHAQELVALAPDVIQRRDLIMLVAGAAATCPLAARTQQL